MGQETVILDHEGRLGVIETTLGAVKKDVADNTKLTKEGFDKITALLQDNNGKGLMTRQALTEQSVGRLWKFITPLVGAILLAAGSQVYSHF